MWTKDSTQMTNNYKAYVEFYRNLQRIFHVIPHKVKHLLVEVSLG